MSVLMPHTIFTILAIHYDIIPKRNPGRHLRREIECPPVETMINLLPFIEQEKDQSEKILRELPDV